MCFIFITPCHLFEGDWIYQYAKHWTVRPLEVKTNKQVVTKLKHHTCSLLHIWILLSQPTTWMIDKYNCTHLSHWQIQLHTLDKHNCTHLKNTIACTCLTDIRQAIRCSKISIHLKFTSGGSLHVLIWMGAITKLRVDCQVEWLQQQDREWTKSCIFLTFGVYRVQEWWSDIPAINKSVNTNHVSEEHILDSILGCLLSDHSAHNFASHASVFIS